MAGDRGLLETTGLPEHERLEGNIRRALTRLGQRGSSDVGYTPAVVADWNGSAPATIAEALDRIASAIGPIP